MPLKFLSAIRMVTKLEEAAKAEQDGDGWGLLDDIAGKAGVQKPAFRGQSVGLGPGGVKLNEGAVRRPKLRQPRVPSKNLRLDQLKMPSRGPAEPAPAGPLLPTQAIFRQKPWLPWWLATLLLVSGLLVAAGAAVPLTKHARRVRRLRRRDPRALAAGVRAELVAVLADRGAQVGRDVTLAELERMTQRVLSLSAGPLLVALGEARFGPAGRAGRAASTARRELGRLLATARFQIKLYRFN